MSLKHTSLVLLLSTSATAWADHAPLKLDALTIEGEQEKPSGLTLDQPIRTGSRLGLTARETPASVSVSDRAVIEERGAKDTQDVINAMTGVNASANPGYGGFVSYRGFTQNQITQLFNGINLGYSSATRPVDAWMIDRVELIGGPSTFLYGAGAVVARSTTSRAWPAATTACSRAACATAASTTPRCRWASTAPWVAPTPGTSCAWT